MKRTDIELVRPARILLTVCLIAWAVPAWGQRGNPATAAGPPPPLSQSPNPFGDADLRERHLILSDVGMIVQPMVERQPIEKHDTINVVIDLTARAASEGELDRRKKADTQASLKDWVLLRGLTLFPDPQTRGDPTVGGVLNKKLRAEGELETSESVKLSIQCEVVCIRPNGLLVLEGHRSYQINSESWEVYYLATFRPEDILPNNSVESQYGFAETLKKQEAGSVRDGYRIGWLQRLMDRYQL